MKTWHRNLCIVFLIFVFAILLTYQFGFNNYTSLSTKPKDPNFNLNLSSDNMQFYENMRYPDSKISYKIADVCTLQKKEDIKRAMEILEERTILEFYNANNNEEISITCKDDLEKHGDYFIAGEGGPTNITKSGKFYVIENGKVLLIRQSKCQNPNIALHELLHALGFVHSKNPNNIMFNVTACSQNLGEDIPNLINQLYNIESYPDLAFENVSPVVHGKYLDVNISIKNNGLKTSENSVLNIYKDNVSLKKIDIQKLKIGYGIQITLTNILIKSKFKELKFSVENNFPEIDKTNNEIIFEVEK